MRDIVTAAAAFIWLVPGLGLLVAPCLKARSPEERLLVAVGGGVVALYLGAELLHLCGAPTQWWWLLSLPAAVGWWSGAREIAAWWRNSLSRDLLIGWWLIALVSLLALSTIRTYSGGDWIGDWVGHFHRARYFLHPDPKDAWIFILDPLTARPPLANLATAALLAHTRGDFAAYQVIATLLATLVAFPVQVLARQFGGARAARLAVVLLLCSPMFLQNATYPWTKLISAAFVLIGTVFYLEAWSSDRPGSWTLAALALVAGLLVHYSAGPYLVVALAALAWRRRIPGGTAHFRRTIVLAGSASIALAATWFGWALASRGWHQIWSATTSAQQSSGLTWVQQLVAFGSNLEHTILPPPWPGADGDSFRLTDALASMRDRAFAFYQTCLPGMVGFGGLTIALLIGADRQRRRDLLGRIRGIAWLAVAAIILIGVAVNPAPVRWGVGHICLQPLALFALAGCAALVPAVPARWGWFVVLMYGVDGLIGIALHLRLEHISVSPAMLMADRGAWLGGTYGLALAQNAAAKHALGLQLVGDHGLSPIVAVPLMLGAAIVMMRRAFNPGLSTAIASS